MAVQACPTIATQRAGDTPDRRYKDEALQGGRGGLHLLNQIDVALEQKLSPDEPAQATTQISKARMYIKLLHNLQAALRGDVHLEWGRQGRCCRRFKRHLCKMDMLERDAGCG